jgi:hypothetical protein
MGASVVVFVPTKNLGVEPLTCNEALPPPMRLVFWVKRGLVGLEVFISFIVISLENLGILL